MVETCDKILYGYENIKSTGNDFWAMLLTRSVNVNCHYG